MWKLKTTDIEKQFTTAIFLPLQIPHRMTFMKALPTTNAADSHGCILLKAQKPDNLESHNYLKLALSIFEVFTVIFFPSIKLSWYLCSVWDKLWWLNWFLQFLCERLSSSNPKGFCYSYIQFMWRRDFLLLGTYL